MKLDISKVNLSRFDIKRELTLPQEMSEKLAEDIGIMIGDGHIGSYILKKKEYQIYVSGNAYLDKDYISNHVRKLKKDLYNLAFPVSVVGRNKSEIRLKICSKGLVGFYNKIIGLPVNKKENIGIPDCIWEKKKYLTSCLRGIIDTDFSLCFKKVEKYPVMHLKTCSMRLVRDCKKALQKLGIKANSYYNILEYHKVTRNNFVTNYLYINGRKKLRKAVEEIGFHSDRLNEKIRAHRDSNPGPNERSF
ncbi:hypothetical protein CMO89_00660 [Candidatus Woesearchaeota archaeon]|nr:hypothetical protein [Candidatus Woesearchaeota archaeon]|tara:strand:- start:4442 stop:5185 length:744 start_codon:yes stop_codon:yes gene_type:complete